MDRREAIKILEHEEDKTLWVKVDSTETLDSFGRVIIEDGEHWCKVFYEDRDTILTERTGEWVPIIQVTEKGEPYIAGIYCSECGETLGCEANYCPNCGSKMRMRGEK